MRMGMEDEFYGIKNRYLEVEEKEDVLIQFSSTV